MEKNKFMRDVSHLISEFCSEEDVLSYLQNVENHFSVDWLNESGEHKLKTLWERKDTLSTNELFAIGKSIKSLSEKHGIWLKKTISDIKKQPEGAHGYVTEILLASSIISEKSKTVPAPSNKPGYDISLDGENGEKILISVKNHDISKHYKDFLKFSESIRDEFISLISALKISARLVIYLNKSISKEIFKECILIMHSKIKGFGEFKSDDAVINIRIIPFGDFNGKPVLLGTDLCLIVAPYHRNEHLGFRRKLEDASINMDKHLPKNNDTARMLYMRLHHAANIRLLAEIANQMIVTEENCGFDQVMLVQPSITRSPDGMSSIHTCFNFSQLRQPTPERNISEVFKTLGRIHFEFPIGIASPSPSMLMLMDGNQLGVQLDECYVYQRGDIKILAEQRDDGSYWGEASSPASGIHIIPFFEINDNFFAIRAIKPQCEELLLI